MHDQKPRVALEPAEAVLKFLASVGPSSEAEFYLRLFRSRARESFAAIAVEAAALEHDADGVALDLRFLGGLGLTPVVVLGLDEPELAAAHRATLAELLHDAGVDTDTFTAGGPHTAIAAAARRGAIPLVSAEEATSGARLESVAALLRALETHKLIFLGPAGGLMLQGEQIAVVNLNTDYEALRANPALDPQQRELLENSRRLVFELVPHRLLVSLTSPLNLLHELFTVKGAGTLLRKGVRITRHDGYTGVSLEQLRTLLESSFGKPLDEGLFSRPVEHLYLEEGYRGAALVLATPLGGYLSKFAVTREAQGEGIGQDLWSALTSDYAALVWRARSDNPIRAWYEQKCQGLFRAGAWTVYHRGLSASQVPSAIELALAQPIDL
jgi:acetylglutamate kinase